MQDLQRRLGLGKARCRREVWRNHYEHASDTGERSRKSIHVVVVGFEELRTLLLPLCRFLRIPYDSSNLLALCKKRARNGTADIPRDSHDCVHIDGSWFLSWLWVTSANRSGVCHQEICIKAYYSGRAMPLRRSQVARSRSCLATSWAGGRVPFFLR